MCVRSLPDKSIGIGRLTRTGKCKLFDAGIGKDQLQISMPDLQRKRKKSHGAASWLGAGWAVRDGQSFATHSAYGAEFSTEYCLLQAMIRNHKFCSVDKTGFYQTGNYVDRTDEDKGRNDLYQLYYPEKPRRKTEL